MIVVAEREQEKEAGSQISNPKKTPRIDRLKGPVGAQEKGWEEAHISAPHCDTAQPWDKESPSGFPWGKTGSCKGSGLRMALNFSTAKLDA